VQPGTQEDGVGMEASGMHPDDIFTSATHAQDNDGMDAADVQPDTIFTSATRAQDDEGEAEAAGVQPGAHGRCQRR
jgi:hypothetical protein